jgi:integrase
MRQNVKVIFKKVKSTDQIGYIRLSFRENGKTHIRNISLKPLPVNYWDAKKCRVSSKFSSYKEYNEKIELALEGFKNTKEEIPQTNKLLFFDCCKDVLTHKNFKNSTKRKYVEHLAKFQNFLNAKGKKDIYIDELTPNLFAEYFNSLPLNNNTLNFNIITIKGFLRNIEKIKDINLPANFYTKISSFKSVPKKPKLLIIDNFQKILNTRMKDTEIENARLIFCFSVFCNGIRFSDVSTLRYKDFLISYNREIPEIRFSKLQRKSGRPINTLINFKCIKILSHFLPKTLLNEDELLKLNQFQVSDEIVNKSSSVNSGEVHKIQIEVNVKLDNELLKRYYHRNPITISLEDLLPKKENFINHLKSHYLQEGMDDISIDAEISSNNDIKYIDDLMIFIEKKIKEDLEKKSKQLFDIHIEFYKIIAKTIEKCRVNCPKDFVFPLLKSNEFYDIVSDNGFSYPNDYQSSKMDCSLATYNQKLYKMCDILEIPRISSHYARSSFGSLLLALKGQNSVNLYDLMVAMGHSSLNITQEYINSLSNDGKDNLTKILGDNF